jgi:hypothetical protein
MKIIHRRKLIMNLKKEANITGSEIKENYTGY